MSRTSDLKRLPTKIALEQQVDKLLTESSQLTKRAWTIIKEYEKANASPGPKLPRPQRERKR